MPTARLSTPGDLVRAVPDLLGFRPESSVVVLCLHGRRHRLGMTARVDLPPPEWEEELVDQLVARVRQESPAACVVIVYDDDERGAPASAQGLAPELPCARLADTIDEALTEADIDVMELLYVVDGRWWSYRCDAPCCPPEGTALEDGTTSILAAVNAIEGRPVFPDREALVASVSRAPGEPTVALLSALRARGAAAARRRPAEVARARRRDRAALGRMIEKRAGELAAGSARASTDREGARAAAALLHAPVLDIAARYLGGRLEAAACELWAELVRRVPEPYATAPATLLGLAMYGHGDGALARAYLDRALEEDPDSRLAQMAASVIEDGLHPQELFTILGLPAGGTLVGRGDAP
jgi:hypothetical protein